MNQLDIKAQIEQLTKSAEAAQNLINQSMKMLKVDFSEEQQKAALDELQKLGTFDVLNKAADTLKNIKNGDIS